MRTPSAIKPSWPTPPKCANSPRLAAGCWLQLTAGSLVGRFGPQAEQAAFDLIDAGWNCLAATDAHSLGLANA